MTAVLLRDLPNCVFMVTTSHYYVRFVGSKQPNLSVTGLELIIVSLLVQILAFDIFFHMLGVRHTKFVLGSRTQSDIIQAK